MAETFKFELVSPARLLISQDVKSVRVPGDEGDFVVMAEHAPFMTTMRPGIVVIDTGDEEKRFFVKSGFADVGPSGLTVLAEFSTDCSEMTSEEVASELGAAKEAFDTAETNEAKRHAHQLVSCLEELQ